MPRIAYLTYSSAEFDGRTRRMARTALAAGYEVVVYARWQPGVPFEEDGLGYRVIRVPAVPDLAIPWRRRRGRRRLRDIMTGAYAGTTVERRNDDEDSSEEGDEPNETPDQEVATPSLARRLARLVWRPTRRLIRRISTARFTYPLMLFPLRPLGWAIPLDETAEPADIWHGMWAGSLPALDRLRAKHGGRTVYDSRDVYMRSRGFERMGAFKAPVRVARTALGAPRRCRPDGERGLCGAARRAIPDRTAAGRPEHAGPVYAADPRGPTSSAQALGLSAETRVVLYQGGLLSDRGIEQGMEAILDVPDAVLAIMGFGSAQAEIEALADSPRFREQVRILERRVAGRTARLDGVGRRDADGHPADERQP